MTRLAQLKSCNNLRDLAEVLGIEPSILSHRLYKIPDSKKYSTFSIPKKTGGIRIIHAPDPRLAFVQRRLATLLQDCLGEIERSQGVETKCAYSHGFRRKRSIVTNAIKHRRRRWIFNVDVLDFFPSINFGRIQGYFSKNRYFSLKNEVATVIAQIACHNGALPQGSPCSPIISDLIASVMDQHLGKMAKSLGCTYTRYADDLTFSSNKKTFPSRIAHPLPDPSHKWSAGNDLVGIVRRAGFALNHAKSRMHYRDSRQSVTGVVVNEDVNVPEEFYKTTRAMCQHLFSRNECFLVDKDQIAAKASRDNLRGRLSFIYDVKNRGDWQNKKRIRTTNSPNFYKLYRKFLDYNYFYAPISPVLMFEGDSDIIHVDSAIRSLRKKYPQLVDPGTGEPIVTYYRTSQVSDAVHHIKGGTGDLNILLGRYADIAGQFTANVTREPVIFILDNDSGSRDLFKKAATLSKTVVDGTAPYYHIVDNLYIVPIPLGGKKAAQIEDLFSTSVLNKRVGGKSLQLDENKFDKNKNFGKIYFANHVVRPARSKISFRKFEPLLAAISDAIADYAMRR